MGRRWTATGPARVSGTHTTTREKTKPTGYLRLERKEFRRTRGASFQTFGGYKTILALAGVRLIENGGKSDYTTRREGQGENLSRIYSTIRLYAPWGMRKEPKNDGGEQNST